MREWRWFGVGLLVATVVACGDDTMQAGPDTDGETDTDTTGSTSLTTGPDDTGTTGGDGSGSSTGVPTDGLVPCDPHNDQCNDGVCSGAPHAGFYCRPTCSSTAEPGDPCSGGVCLQASELNTETACVELSDCDPLDGSGCTGASEGCVIVTFDPLRTACVPSGTTGPGMQCDPAFEHDCDHGLGCLGSDLQGDDPGVCTPWCEPSGALPPGCSQCVPITEEIGSCAECSVVANDCPDGSECQPVNEALGGLCVPHGDAGEDEMCDFESPCQEGHLCLETDVDDVFACVQKCDRNDPMCDDAAKSCIDVAQLVEGVDSGQLGVCIETDTMFCDPDARPTGCAGDEICLEVEPGLGVCGAQCDPTDGGSLCDDNYACIPFGGEEIFVAPFVVGNGACGTGCSADADCGGGNTCLLLDGVEADGVCGSTCDPAGNDCGANEACVTTAADPNVGACIPEAAACDPATLDSCVGQGTPNTACVAVEGGAAGVCLPPCFEQDPNACGGMPDQCQVRSDAAFHGGVCLGQSMPCDVVAQDCPDPNACSILGGGAIGGAAYLCGEAGPLAEGGDCSADADACATGLECVGGTCRAYCDPTNDQCASGTCTDISAMFYLPADTVGACM